MIFACMHANCDHASWSGLLLSLQWCILGSCKHAHQNASDSEIFSSNVLLHVGPCMGLCWTLTLGATLASKVDLTSSFHTTTH